ncbi:MAG: hypothetical protein QMD92_00225 [bacterium]|nr:hypothetical protein [bacterium]
MKVGRRESIGRKSMLHPNLRDIAWAAGIFEGEGWAGTNGASTAMATVTQITQWLPIRLKILFGGAIYTKHCSDSLNPSYCWQITGSRALGFLQTIYYFLSPKRQSTIKHLLAAAKLVRLGKWR